MVKKRRQSFFDAIWSSVLWTSLDRGTALFKHVYIASMVGLSAELDVFYMTIGLLSLLVFSWARVADVIAVPRLVELSRSGESSAVRDYSGDLFSLSLLFSVTLAGILHWTWPVFTRLAWGFDEQRRSLLEESIDWVMPIVLLYVPIRILYSIAKVRRTFYLSYRNEFLTSIIILLCITLYPESRGVLLWSFSLGVAVAFVIAFASTWRDFSFPRYPWSRNVRLLLPLVPGLLILYGAQYLYSLVDRQFVSFLPKGAVSAIAYGWTLTGLVPALLRLEGAFITVYAETSDDPGLRSEKVNNLIMAGLTVGAVMTFFIFGFSDQIIGLLLQRGAFTRDDTLLVSDCTAYFAFSVIPMLLIGPMSQIFQVEQKVRFIIKRIIFGVVLNIVFGFVFMFVYHWGSKGVALATSLSQWGMLVASLASINRLGLNIDFRRHGRWLLLMVLISVLALWGAESIRQYHDAYWMIVPESIVYGLLFCIPILTGKGRECLFIRGLVFRSFRKFEIRKT